MELADYWLLEKQLVHKLFKVLVPRYENSNISYTRMFKAPRDYPGIYYRKSVLELRGNPYPVLTQDNSQNRNLLHNVLLDEARKEFRREKLAELANKLAAETDTGAATTAATQATTAVSSTSPSSSEKKSQETPEV